MKERRRFRPTTVEWLETRVVLNASAHIAPVSVGHVTTNARNAATQAVVNNVNSSFDSFTSDYLQAQGAYFAAGSRPRGLILRSGNTSASGSNCWQPN